MTTLSRFSLASVLLIGLVACGKKDDDRGHVSLRGHVHIAPHGGTLVEIGEHAYTLELLRDAATGRLTAWVLDGHAENFMRIKAASLDLVATLGTGKQPLTLKAVPNSATGETVGDTSQFEGQADWLKSTAGFDVVVPFLDIRGTIFEKITFNFPKSAP